MRLLKNESVNGKTELTIERNVLFFFKKTEKYKAVHQIAGRFYSWVKLPNHTSVPDWLSFQLDTFKEVSEED